MTADRDDERRIERMDAYLARAAAKDADHRSRRTGVRRAWPAPPLDALLAFEAEWEGKPSGRKESVIARTFGGMSVTSYRQHLNRALGTREALELNPGLVNRLLARRDQMTTARATRTFPNRRA